MRRRQHSKSVASVTAAFIERLFEAVERTIDARTRILTAEWLALAVAAPADSEEVGTRPPRVRSRPHALSPRIDDHGAVVTATVEATNRPPATPRLRGKRLGTRVRTSSTAAGAPLPSPLPSPEADRRDAEFARLRSLLRPTGDHDTSGAAETPSARAPALLVAPPPDPIRLLEDEVRAQAHTLGQLPGTSCTARIAAWAGRIRSYQETGNRVAAELLLDKLRALARAMDAGRIEALNGSWRTRDWPSYIRTNEAMAEAREHEPATPAESLPDQSGDSQYRDIWSQPA